MYSKITYTRDDLCASKNNPFIFSYTDYGASFISPFYFASALPEKARYYPVNSSGRGRTQWSYNWPFASSPTRSSTISRRWSLSRPGDGETAGFEKRERHDPASVECRRSRELTSFRKQYNGIGFELRTYLESASSSPVNKGQRIKLETSASWTRFSFAIENDLVREWLIPGW